MYCIKSFIYNRSLRAFDSDDNIISVVYFEDPNDAFDYIRFCTPCSSEDFIFLGVYLVPCSDNYKNELNEYKFHYNLSSLYLRNPNGLSYVCHF